MALKVFIPNAKLDKFGKLVARQTRVRGYESCEYNGARYDSRAEAGYAAQLDLRKKVREIRSWRRQITVELVVNGKPICSMRVDFLVTFADGHEEYHEVKGFETREWGIKRNLFRALFPDRVYLVIPAGGKSRGWQAKASGRMKQKRVWPKRTVGGVK